MTPRATYRLQFHSEFKFEDAARLAPYFASLGVSHIYASPISTARAGSRHGYDVVDPTTINPELGGEDAFRAMAAALRREGLGVILDIVPNHMAVGGSDNQWWLDVLEKGEASAHAQFFDIDWRPADQALHGKVLAPFLGAPYAQALADGDMVLEYDADAGRLFVMAYGAHRFPIREEDYAAVIQGDPASIPARYDPRDDAGRARLHALLERQHFRLAWWRTAGDEINWRRFFDVTELAGVRVERPEVFETLHALPLRLYREGLIDGVRADHVDGLADPGAYCRNLRRRLDGLSAGRPDTAPGGPAYILVEKILARGERLSPDWGCDGTTGYDYMNEAAALLHDPRGERPLSDHWGRLSHRAVDFRLEEQIARREILTRSFAGQLASAVAAFHRIARSTLETRDVSAGALRRGLIALLSVFPVYRPYGRGDAAPAADRPFVERAACDAKALAAPGEGPVLDQIAAWLLGEGPGDPALAREAARRFQQLSAPVSAKAVEDTAFYRYGRLLSRNDVGFDPSRFSTPVSCFHDACAERARTFPHAMLTTATHDHKRGEDVRARLAALSEIPDRWTEAAHRWSILNRPLDEPIDPADEYTLYQTLVGAWPLDLLADDAAGLAAFRDRVAGWQEKALREAKLRSSWTALDAAYEGVCRRFLDGVLDAKRSSAFLDDLIGFVSFIAPAGALNGLVQAVLRCTSPGVPDLYQGAEFWDLSLVDPDNRRPVDYQARIRGLKPAADAASALADWRDGRVKQATITRALRLRQALPDVFLNGDYRALEITGARADHVLAFVRRSGDAAVLTAAPLHCAAAVVGTGYPLPSPRWWEDTVILAPDDLADFVDSATGERLGGALRVQSLFQAAPFSMIQLNRP
jgi:(1->4)-alpha-D-glucan 1-alpha-D-glucosylmutase